MGQRIRIAVVNGFAQVGAADVIAALCRWIAPCAVLVPVPCRKAQLAVVAHGDGTPTQVFDCLNCLGLGQVVHLLLTEIIHPRAGRSVGIDRIQNVLRRYVDVDRGNRINRAHLGNRIRREHLPRLPCRSRLCRNGLCIDPQRKVQRHRHQPERRNRVK